jgi:hypothetical protein
MGGSEKRSFSRTDGEENLRERLPGTVGAPIVAWLYAKCCRFLAKNRAAALFG